MARSRPGSRPRPGGGPLRGIPEPCRRLLGVALPGSRAKVQAGGQSGCPDCGQQVLREKWSDIVAWRTQPHLQAFLGPPTRPSAADGVPWGTHFPQDILHAFVPAQSQGHRLVLEAVI